MTIPKWAQQLLAIVAILIIMAICKADFCVGANGLHFTQGLIH